MKDAIGSVMRIVLGAGMAQAITLLCLPFITRIYSPAAYGIYAIALAIVALLAVVSTLQLNQAIVIPTTNSHARLLAQTGFFSSALGGAFTCAAFFAFTSVATDWDGLLALLVGLAVVAAGCSLMFQGLAIRSKAFGSIGTASSLRALTQGGVQLLLGRSTPTEAALLGGYIAGEVMVSALLFRRTRHILRSGEGASFSKRTALVSIRRYRDFTGYGTLTEALNSVSHGVPVFLLGVYFGQAVAGLYSFAMRVLLAPGQLIANAVRQVLLQRFARLVKEVSALRSEFYVATVALAVPSLAGALVLGPYLPDLFGWVFGVEWRYAGDLGRWLVLWVAFLVFNAPSSVIMRVARKQRQNLLLNILILGSRILVLVVSGIYLSALQAIALFALLGAFWNLVYIFVARHYLPEGQSR